jgi:outer membrane lipoprotein-sorting protein
MMYFFSYLAVILGFSAAAYAQTARDIAAALESTYFSGEAVKAVFQFGAAGTVTINAASDGSKYRIETRSLTLVNDGTAIYSYDRIRNRVTISDAPKNSGAKVSDLLHLRDNYSAFVRSSSKNELTVAFIPNVNLKEASSQLKIDSLHCIVSKQKLNVKNIRIFSADESPQPGKLKITPIKKITGDIFLFQTPKGAHITDIRE